MLGDNIKTIRKNRGFTQEDLAARLHVTRQTVSKWEKGYSVPDADLLSRMAEVFEVPVQELLGEPSQPSADPDPIVEQLSRLNEQLVIKNRRAARIWKIIGITLAAIALLYIALVVSGIVLFRAETREAAGSVQWTGTLEGDTYIFGVEYTENYRIISGFSQVSDEVPLDLMEYGDAREAQAAMYEWFEARGGTVAVTGQKGLPLPAYAKP